MSFKQFLNSSKDRTEKIQKTTKTPKKTHKNTKKTAKSCLKSYQKNQQNKDIPPVAKAIHHRSLPGLWSKTKYQKNSTKNEAKTHQKNPQKQSLDQVCDPCPVGKFTAKRGSSACERCPEGLVALSPGGGKRESRF